MREDWLRAQDRKRRILAWSITGIAYLLIGGLVVLRSVFGYESLSSGMGTVQIRIGTPEGEDEFSRIIPALSSGGAEYGTVPPEEPVAPPEPPTEEQTVEPSTGSSILDQAESAPESAQPQAAAPKPVAQPKTTQPAAASASAKPSAAAGAASPPSGSGPSVPGAIPSEVGIPTGSPTGSGSVSLKGSEAGNSFETNFDTGSGKISRSLYVPIYLYMPLPKFLDRALYDAVPQSKFGLETAELRKAHLRDIYDMRGTLLTLKGEIPLSQRPSIWVILEDAGYPLAKADYKSGRNLKPIIIEFSVGAPASDYSSSGAPLLSSTVVSSSGYPEIDEAVLYAFRMAGFSNNGKVTVKGRFTYNFD